ncbi:MAG TPA: hypothetical protein VN445_12355 [Rectinemataceae bacterium]|nr:hypothetical protein [Rectinemataceae bacterium]
MISFERWKDGFVMTVEGLRVLRHASSSPAIFIWVATTKAVLIKAEGRKDGKGMSWRNPGACEIINEGPELTVLEFGSFCTIRISYTERVLHFRFFPSPASPEGIRIRFGANPKEKLFGAGPSTNYDLKGRSFQQTGSGSPVSPRGDPTIMSNLGAWIHVDTEESVGWHFRASVTEVSCSSLPREIALGFGKTQSMGMELLTRYKAGKLVSAQDLGHTTRSGEGAGPGKLQRGRIPEALQAGLVSDLRGGGENPAIPTQEAAALEGLAPCAVVFDGENGRNAGSLVLEGETWEKTLEKAFAFPLSFGFGTTKSAENLVTAILSLSLTGMGNVFVPVEAPSGKKAESDGRGMEKEAAFTLEIAPFGPLFVVHGPTQPRDEALARRVAAAAKVYEMLKPYREFCSRKWVKDGIPTLIHPALFYRDEDSLWEYRDQYMFGPDMLIAPTSDAGARRLCLPRDEWIHLWTSRRYRGGETVVDAPRGKPAVFYRSGSEFAGLFDSIRQKATRF